MLSRVSRGVRGCVGVARRGLAIPADKLGPSQEVLGRINALEEQGVGYFEHIMKGRGEFDESSAPVFADKPELLRAVEHESNARGYVRRFPFVTKSAKGIVLTDTDGRQWYDCLGCAGTLALGHNHDVITGAIREYLDSGAPQQMLDMSTVVKDRFVESFLSVVPDELSVVQHASPAGTDVLDAAVKLSKIATGRRHVLCFHGGYHGHGHGPLAMMGNLGTKTKVPGTMADVHFLPFPYQYRNPFGIQGPEGEKAVLTYIETLLGDDESGIPAPAALVMEAIQGEGGVNPISPHALQEIRRITKERGIVLIMDEVQAGVCRSGDFWAFEESGVVPDILCTSKAIGGSMPMAIMAYRPELDVWGPGSHTGTFRGNQIAFATGRASLEFMKETKLWEEVAQKGQQLRKNLESISCPAIGDIRGRGLMLGVEFVHPEGGPVDHRGWPMPHTALATQVQVECIKKGLIIERGGRMGAVLRFLSPLIITPQEIDIVSEIFADAVKTAQEKVL